MSLSVRTLLEKGGRERVQLVRIWLEGGRELSFSALCWREGEDELEMSLTGTLKMGEREGSELGLTGTLCEVEPVRDFHS